MSDREAKDRLPLTGDNLTDQEIGKPDKPLSGRLCRSTPEIKISDQKKDPKFGTDLSMPTENLLEFSCKLLSQDPSSQLFVPLAEEFCARKLWNEAVETCRRGLVYHPRQFRGRVLLGWALWELGQVEEAERLLTEARTELEKSAVIYKILAELADRRGDADQAWRLMHIYQSLQDGRSQGEGEIESNKTSPEIAPEPPEKEGPSTIDFLLSLLLEYEQRNPPALPGTQLLSDEDRRMLKEIINTGTS